MCQLRYFPEQNPSQISNGLAMKTIRVCFILFYHSRNSLDFLPNTLCLMGKKLPSCSVFENCILNAFNVLCSKLVIIILEFKLILCVMIDENELSYELCFLSDIKAKTNGITK